MWSNLNDEFLDIGLPLRISMHAFHMGVVWFHPDIFMFTILSWKLWFICKHGIIIILIIQDISVKVRLPWLYIMPKWVPIYNLLIKLFSNSKVTLDDILCKPPHSGVGLLQVLWCNWSCTIYLFCTVINGLHNIQMILYIKLSFILDNIKVLHHIFVHDVPLYNGKIGVK